MLTISYLRWKILSERDDENFFLQVFRPDGYCDPGWPGIRGQGVEVASKLLKSVLRCRKCSQQVEEKFACEIVKISVQIISYCIKEHISWGMMCLDEYFYIYQSCRVANAEHKSLQTLHSPLLQGRKTYFVSSKVFSYFVSSNVVFSYFSPPRLSFHN